jgi:hypothetical protein
MKTMKLGMLMVAVALGFACGQANETADVGAGDAQTFSEAAGELESDIAADVSAGADAAAEAEKDAAE